MEPSKIGYIKWILSRTLWGKVLVNNRLRSKHWWESELNKEINSPPIEIKEFWECHQAEPAPIPYEIEMKLTM